jgi:hypothetical protein
MIRFPLPEGDAARSPPFIFYLESLRKNGRNILSPCRETKHRYN